MDTIPREIFIRRLDSIKARLDSHFQEIGHLKNHVINSNVDSLDKDKWIIALKSIENYLRYNLLGKSRDIGMAEVGIDLISHLYPNQKNIVWAYIDPN